jgi:hypothetical protein
LVLIVEEFRKHTAQWKEQTCPNAESKWIVQVHIWNVKKMVKRPADTKGQTQKRQYCESKSNPAQQHQGYYLHHEFDGAPVVCSTERSAM